MAKVVRTIGPWKAVWEGGPYIEVFHVTKSYPLDVINVYDYATGEVNMPASEVKPQLREWIDEVGADYEKELPYL